MEPTVKLEVNVAMLNIILNGLAKLPLEMSVDTFNFVRQQAEAQLGGPNAPHSATPQAPMADKVIN